MNNRPKSFEVYQRIFHIVERIMKTLRLPTNDVLDIGCGAGYLSMYLKKIGFEPYGIDSSPTAIEQAKQNCYKMNMRIKFKIGNYIKLDYTDSFFAGVIDTFNLDKFEGDDKLYFINEVKRLLMPGGCFILITASERPEQIFRKRLNLEKNQEYMDANKNILTVLSAAGFNVIEWNVYEDILDYPIMIIQAQKNDY